MIPVSYTIAFPQTYFIWYCAWLSFPSAIYAYSLSLISRCFICIYISFDSIPFHFIRLDILQFTLMVTPVVAAPLRVVRHLLMRPDIRTKPVIPDILIQKKSAR